MSVKLWVRYAVLYGVPLALATVKVPALDWAREQWQLAQIERTTTPVADEPSDVKKSELDESELEPDVSGNAWHERVSQTAGATAAPRSDWLPQTDLPPRRVNAGKPFPWGALEQLLPPIAKADLNDDPEQEHPTEAAQPTKAPMGHEAVHLPCDRCGQHIDDLGVAMFFWWTANRAAEPEAQLTVRRVAVGHKACYPNQTPDERSAELGWFSTKEGAKAEVDFLLSDYRWTPDQLDRLNQVTRTVPLIATADDAKAADWLNGPPLEKA